MSKHVVFKQEARDSLKKGVDTVADAVRVTMGPKGRAVIIQRGNTPVFTLDGVTVAQSIEKLKNPIEDMGAQLVKDVASRTNDSAGDGTTTATLLTQSLLNEGLRGVEQGIDPIIMKATLEHGVNVVLDDIKAHGTKEVKTKEQMKAIATISSRDEEIGGTIAEIYDKIGKDGVITTEEVKQIGIDYEIVNGMQVDNGFAAPHFITNSERSIAEIEKPYILVTSQNIRTIEDIGPIMREVAETDSKSLVVIADDCQGEALATLIINKLNRIMNTLVIKAPGFGDNKREHMEDICAITGADYITEELGTRVEEATLENLGRADRIIAYQNRAIIVGGKGDKKAIADRKNIIKKQLDDAESPYKKENLTIRLAKINGGVAVIRVGDVTEQASREKQYRIEDAINATKSAIEEGVVEGGGLALYKASTLLDDMAEEEKDADKRFALQALSKAIKKPAKQILDNQGKNADVILAVNYKLPNDVIDPFKVERVALQQASSVVGLYLISEAVVYEHDDKEDKKND